MNKTGVAAVGRADKRPAPGPGGPAREETERTMQALTVATTTRPQPSAQSQASRSCLLASSGGVSFTWMPPTPFTRSGVVQISICQW